MIGRNGERGSGISALAARHDDDDDDDDDDMYLSNLYQTYFTTLIHFIYILASAAHNVILTGTQPHTDLVNRRKVNHLMYMG